MTQTAAVEATQGAEMTGTAEAAATQQAALTLTASGGTPGGPDQGDSGGGQDATPDPNQTPAATPTLKEGEPIVLKASKDGYGEDTKSIDNAINYEGVIIEGTVYDQEGNGVDSALVEVVSGASSSSIYTNADGTYSLVAAVSGGQGNGIVRGVDFNLQLEGDLSFKKIELVQAVSGSELADYKHTAALVFPQFTSQARSSVDTKVTLYVNEQEFKTLPFRVKSQYTLNDHQKVFDAVKFFIPPSFVRTGPFYVKAVIDPDNAFPEPDENNNEKTYAQVVESSRGLSMVMVALSPRVSAADASAWATEARRFLANTYPVPVVRIVDHPVYANGWLMIALALRDAQITNNALVAYNNANPSTRVEYGVGIYPFNDYGSGVRGLIYRHLYPHAPLVSQVFPVTIAHEIGHVYLGGNEEADADPILNGVSLPEGYVYNHITGMVRFVRPNSNWINIMGDPYAGHEQGSVVVRPWISPTAYNTILSARGSASLSTVKEGAMSAPNWTANADYNQVLHLSGALIDGDLQVLPPVILDTREVSSYPAGDFTASIQDAGGTVLAEATFGLDSQPGEYGAPNPGAFMVEVPYPVETARLVITNGGQEFYRLEKTVSAPAVLVDQPGGGNPVVGETSVTWSASDSDGDNLTHDVYYSPDGGASWQLIGYGLTDPNVSIDGALLPGSDEALIRVVSSDGLNTGQAVSPPFEVPTHAPSVEILPPDQDSEPWEAGHPNLLAATGEDIEDGLLPPEAFEWESDQDGDLGTGNAAYVALSEGTHEISVVVRDSDGQEARAQIEITVSKAPDDSTFDLSDNTMLLVGGGICLVVLAGVVIGAVVVYSRRRSKSRGRPVSSGDPYQRVEDVNGRWWYQDRSTGYWYTWNGQTWQPAPPGVQPNLPGRRRR
jgi:hypothetical protein